MMITHDELRPLVRSGLLTRIRHPSRPWTLYNYTRKCQYERLWTPETILCRGLVLHDSNQVISRPFPKFFNRGERPEEEEALQSEPYYAYEKIDGTLLIVTRVEDELLVHTRGSFTGFHVEEGRAILEAILEDPLAWIEEGWTYCFEMIHPQSRIVIDYGDWKTVVLLAVIETATGRERDLGEITDFPAPVNYRLPSWALEEMDETDREGLVLHYFRVGKRLKVKFAEYLRLHRLVMGMSSQCVWDLLRSGEPLDTLIQGVPDELDQWIRDTERDLRQQYQAVEQRLIDEFTKIKSSAADRREFAAMAMRSDLYNGLFALLDGKDYSKILWDHIRPRASDTFRSEEKR